MSRFPGQAIIALTVTFLFLEVVMQSRLYESLRVSKNLLCLLLLLSAATLRAQTFRGGVNGTISDQSGAVVAGAVVALVDNATSVASSSS